VWGRQKRDLVRGWTEQVVEKAVVMLIHLVEMFVREIVQEWKEQNL
jgi:hypothetical protein